MPSISDTSGDTTNRPVRTRFAPSPTGFLHVGAFRTALFSYLLAKKHNGQFILRVEDTDQNRLVPGSLQNLIASLRALGMNYDEGPDQAQVAALDKSKYGDVDPALLPAHGGDFGPYFQSQRLPRYREVVEQLLEEGKAYYAFETPEELEGMRAAATARRLPYRYGGRYRDYSLGEARDRVAKGEPSVVRFKMPQAGPIRGIDALHGEVIFDATTQDDFVILKGDGFPPYHLAAIVDDHDMQVSHVLRGDDWLPSFPKHVCLVEALGWEQPVWVHCPNVNGPDGKKLAKRHGALPIIGPAPELKDGKPTGDELKGFVNQEGYLPEALVNYLALCGWSPGGDREVMPLPELLEAFSLEGIGTSPGIFDIQKLTWMDGVYIRQLSPEEFASRAMPFLQSAGLLPTDPTGEQHDYAARTLALEQERVKKLSEAPEVADFFFPELPTYDPKSTARWLQKPGTAAFLTALSEAYDALTDWSHDPIEAATREVGAKLGREKGEVTHPVRVALSGRETGPGLFDIVVVLGRERVRKRLAHAAALETATKG